MSSISVMCGQHSHGLYVWIVCFKWSLISVQTAHGGGYVALWCNLGISVAVSGGHALASVSRLLVVRSGLRMNKGDTNVPMNMESYSHAPTRSRRNDCARQVDLHI
jgi:hypothetical protein